MALGPLRRGAQGSRIRCIDLRPALTTSGYLMLEIVTGLHFSQTDSENTNTNSHETEKHIELPTQV